MALHSLQRAYQVAEWPWYCAHYGLMLVTNTSSNDNGTEHDLLFSSSMITLLKFLLEDMFNISI